MTWLVVYDIGDDGIRGRVAKLCERYGERVQESVFECRLDVPGVARLKKELPLALGAPTAGNIRLYRVCQNCLDESFGFGNLRSAGRGPYLIV